ncbi:MAG: flagellar motor protein MotD [Dyella sp.]
MRRRRHDEHTNHEAWVIPYADLLTLLLALFVVLYAMSSLNTTKYRALAQAISAAFNGSHQIIQPMQPSSPQSRVPVPAATPTQTPSAPLNRVPLPMPTTQVSTRTLSQTHPVNLIKLNNEQQNLDRIRDEVERALQPLIDKNMVVVRRTTNWLEIEIRTDILFPSGVATLSTTASQVLTKLGDILAPFSNPLRVEGYTDDMPINTNVYPSNWELSAARAASVARLFAEHGVAPDRLGIIGWGQYHPSVANDSVDGRNQNRRVLVVVLSDRAAPTRFYSNTDQIGLTASAVTLPPGGSAASTASAVVMPASSATSAAATPALSTATTARTHASLVPPAATSTSRAAASEPGAGTATASAPTIVTVSARVTASSRPVAPVAPGRKD